MTSDVFVECLKKDSRHVREYVDKKTEVIALSVLSLALESKIKKLEKKLKNYEKRIYYTPMSDDADESEKAGILMGKHKANKEWLEWLELCVKEAKRNG